MTVRDATPLSVVREQGCERFGVTSSERFRRGAKPVDHPPVCLHGYARVSMSRMVELLFFSGCPSARPARDLVQRIAAEEAVSLDLKLVEVSSPEDAEALRFLGSPSIRVDGHDVEPGAEERVTFALGCRVYRTDEGLRPLPAEAWIRAAVGAANAVPAPRRDLHDGTRHDQFVGASQEAS
jgi:hypothetical protein